MLHASSSLDSVFQAILSTIKAYIKGSGELMVKLKALVILPENAYLFTADATYLSVH